jgi:NCK-associated protein 1
VCRIADFLKKYEQPIRRLQDDCGEISMRVGDTLMPFQAIINKWSQVKQMVDTRVFNVIDEPKNMGIPFDERSHIELIQLDNYKRWILYGFLICPAELQRPGALEMLGSVLKEVFVLQVFRDKVLRGAALQACARQSLSRVFVWFAGDPHSRGVL